MEHSVDPPGGGPKVVPFDYRDGGAFLLEDVPSLLQVSWAGRLFCDATPQGSVLTDVLSGKQVVLQGHHTVAAVDDLAAVVNEETETEHEPQTLLGQHFLKCSVTGDLLLFSVDGESHKFIREFESNATAHETGTCTVSVGCARATLKLGCYVFSEPRRGNLRVFWNLKHVYVGLSLQSFGGGPSKWVYDCRGKWGAAFQKYFGCCQLIGGTSSGHGQGKQQDDKTHVDFYEHFVDRCLANARVSSAGLLALLSRFSFNSQNGGGLSDGRGAASEVLTSFVEHAAKLLVRSGLRFAVDADRCMRWPRPEFAGMHIMLHVGPGGDVDLSQLRSLANGEPSQWGKLANTWMKPWAKEPQQWSCKLQLWDLLRNCCKEACWTCYGYLYLFLFLQWDSDSEIS